MIAKNITHILIDGESDSYLKNLPIPTTKYISYVNWYVCKHLHLDKERNHSVNYYRETEECYVL